MTKKSVGTAYLLWCLCFVGICGGQRFYAGKVGSGLLYLFTLGWLGIGQFIDLFLIPEMIGGSGSGMAMAHATAYQNVNVNLGDLTKLIPQSPSQSSTEMQTHLQKLITAAKANNGRISLAEAITATNLNIEETKQILKDAEQSDLCHTCNDAETGKIRYEFDI